MNLALTHGPLSVQLTDASDVVEAAGAEVDDPVTLNPGLLLHGSVYAVVREDAAQGGSGRIVGVCELRPTDALDRYSTTDAYRVADERQYDADARGTGLVSAELKDAFTAAHFAANEEAGPQRLTPVLGASNSFAG